MRQCWDTTHQSAIVIPHDTLDLFPGHALTVETINTVPPNIRILSLGFVRWSPAQRSPISIRIQTYLHILWVVVLLSQWIHKLLTPHCTECAQPQRCSRTTTAFTAWPPTPTPMLLAPVPDPPVTVPIRIPTISYSKARDRFGSNRSSVAHSQQMLLADTAGPQR